MKKLQNFTQVISLLACTSIFLISCGTSETPSITGTPEVSTSTGTNATLNSSTGTNIPPPSNQESMIERIKNMNTLEDLLSINPSIANDPKKDNPKFIELQKKQMILGMSMSQISTPEYKDIQKNISNIYEAKEFWTPEIQALDVKIQEAMNNITSSTGSSPTGVSSEINTLFNEKNTLMQAMRKSKEYQEYIKNNQSKIDSLNAELKKFYTPEILSLDKELSDLRQEVYGTPETK